VLVTAGARGRGGPGPAAVSVRQVGVVQSTLF
jgi:hypothetical protein